jgi:flagellar motor switch protein FliM
VLGLAPGDVLTLPLAADRPIDVDAGGVKKLTGRLAADQGRLLVMVEARMGRSLPVPAEKVETDG